MAGGIAHEINNPLSVITLRSHHIKHLLSGDSPKISQALELLNVIASTAYRISNIVQGMQSFSRNADKDPLKKTRLEVIINDTLSLCTEKIKNNGVDIQVDIQDISIEIQCRPAQICQVLLNLIMNANDAISCLNEKWIKIVVNKIEGTAHITVMDSGVSISDAVYEKMFQPFFTTKEIGKGTGLGLSISKGIIEHHNGSLTLDRSSKHTCFVISLPCAEMESKEAMLEKAL
jgi:C4-dicarboxylate-specific signal transduction histidine kinase